MMGSLLQHVRDAKKARSGMLAPMMHGGLLGHKFGDQENAAFDQMDSLFGPGTGGTMNEFGSLSSVMDNGPGAIAGQLQNMQQQALQSGDWGAYNHYSQQLDRIRGIR